MSAESGKPSVEAQRGLEALQTAVRNALDRKRRLGQHAVIMRNDRIEILDWREDSDEQQPVGKSGPK